MHLFSQTHLLSWYFLLTDSDPSENLDTSADLDHTMLAMEDLFSGIKG